MPGAMLIARDTKITGKTFASRGSQTGTLLPLIFWFPAVNIKKKEHLPFKYLLFVGSIRGFLEGNGVSLRWEEVKIGPCYNGETEAG